MNRLILADNKIGDEEISELSACLHNVDDLGLANCNITSFGIERLSQAISQRTHSVKQLLIIWLLKVKSKMIKM